MNQDLTKTHTDGIWVSLPREIAVIQQVVQHVQQQGFVPVQQDLNNYGYPYIFVRDQQQLHCRFVDSVFQSRSIPEHAVLITDSVPLSPVSGTLLSAVPEFWSIWHFDPDYQDRPPVWAYNCFMNRPRGERSRVYYELIKRNLLTHGIVSFNLDLAQYQQQYRDSELWQYQLQHDQAQVPYNNLTGTLEQCVIDSRVSLIMETYINDDYIVFSEKTFRCLQLPRPWLLYCSPGAVGCLRDHGFDLLDDYVDHAYDSDPVHYHRLDRILDQLTTFVYRTYSDQDLARFRRAVQHNQQRLQQLAAQWPNRLNQILETITCT